MKQNDNSRKKIIKNRRPEASVIMRDGYVIEGKMQLSRGGWQMLTLLSYKRGGYLDPLTKTANTSFGFSEPIKILYFERTKRELDKKRPIGDKKFRQREITLTPDPNFNLFTCFSKQGGNS